MTKNDKYITNLNIGLTNKEVEERISKGLINKDNHSKTKTIKEIILENTFTLFNIINIILGVAILLVGSFKNLVFLLIVLANTLISIYQEVRTKKTLDQLEIATESKILTIRDGKELLLLGDELVKDDLIILKPGNSIVVDSILLDGECEVDESAITGESIAVNKKVGDMLISGSFIVSGTVKAQVKNIGKENFVSKLESDTKYIKPVSSEIMKSLNKIIKTISLIIIPIGILLFYRQLYLADNNITNAVVNTSAAIIGMIPEGLVLLTSTVLAVSVYNLSKENVLVQDLYCIESLARVDVLCLDKTGTITKGEMEIVDVINKEKVDSGEIAALIVKNTKDENPTALAIRNKYKTTNKIQISNVFPFQSKTKMSGIEMEDGKKYYIGAPEFILPESIYDKNKKEIEKYSNEYRIICVIEKNKTTKLLGYILLQDKIRENAKDVLDYFKKNEVTLKIISGDNPLTVKNIAERAGLTNLKYIDATKLKTEKDEIKSILENDIIGRVTPHQKKDFVIALQNEGHTVAMTGDGVNDVLALKEADCSVAMASGADCTKNVSNLVLLDSDFKSMPKIVSEGRRTINNIERSASLFLAKTIYACVLSFLFIFIRRSYPFIPIQLTLASISTIGIPSFMLSFESNNDRVKKGFLKTILRRSFPPALTIIVAVLITTIIGYLMNLSYTQISTLSVLITSIISFMLLYKISEPLNNYRKILLFTMITLFTINYITMKETFSFAKLDIKITIILIILIFISYILYEFLDKELYDTKQNIVKHVNKFKINLKNN